MRIHQGEPGRGEGAPLDFSRILLRIQDDLLKKCESYRGSRGHREKKPYFFRLPARFWPRQISRRDEHLRKYWPGPVPIMLSVAAVWAYLW